MNVFSVSATNNLEPKWEIGRRRAICILGSPPRDLLQGSSHLRISLSSDIAAGVDVPTPVPCDILFLVEARNAVRSASTSSDSHTRLCCETCGKQSCVDALDCTLWF